MYAWQAMQIHRQKRRRQTASKYRQETIRLYRTQEPDDINMYYQADSTYTYIPTDSTEVILLYPANTLYTYLQTTGLNSEREHILSCGQVTFKKQLSYFTSVTCKSNSLLLIRYPFLIVTVPLQLLVTGILNVTKQLLVTTKSNQLRSRTVTPLL